MYTQFYQKNIFSLFKSPTSSPGLALCRSAFWRAIQARRTSFWLISPAATPARTVGNLSYIVLIRCKVTSWSSLLHLECPPSRLLPQFRSGPLFVSRAGFQAVLLLTLHGPFCAQIVDAKVSGALCVLLVC